MATPSASALWALAAFLLALASCGTASRKQLAAMEFGGIRADPLAVEALRGREPGLGPIWAFSAAAAGRNDPEAALELARRGLRHHPGHPDLTFFQVDVLAREGRDEELIELLHTSLAALPRPAVEAWLRASLVRTLLANDELDQAWTEILRLGGVVDVPPGMVADSWARLALCLEFLGQAERADEAMDFSLDRGPEGRSALANETAFRRERVAASRSLTKRTFQRHPGHPDMALACAVDLMLAEEPVAAEAALTELPSPVPARLASEVFAVKARLALTQGRHDEGLEILQARLRRAPADAYALDVLVESWMTRGVPDDELAAQLLGRAWRTLPRGSPMRERIQAVLTDIDRKLKSAVDVGPPSP